MHVPVPKNRLVAFTLVGGLLTAVVAGGLAFPGVVGLGDDTKPTDDPAAQQVADSAPTPNENFTPAVQQQADSDERTGDGEYEEEYEEEEEEEEYEEEEEEEEYEEEEGEEEYEEEEYEDEERGE
jgi:hypothetical protein